MNLGAILSLAAGLPLQALVDLLAVAAQQPELKDQVDKVNAWLSASVTPESLVTLLGDIATEGKVVLGGTIQPADHPSDAA